MCEFQRGSIVFASLFAAEIVGCGRPITNPDTKGRYHAVSFTSFDIQSNNYVIT